MTAAAVAVPMVEFGGRQLDSAAGLTYPQNSSNHPEPIHRHYWLPLMTAPDYFESASATTRTTTAGAN
jgi:hypothetical protein